MHNEYGQLLSWMNWLLRYFLLVSFLGLVWMGYLNSLVFYVLLRAAFASYCSNECVGSCYADCEACPVLSF